MATVPLLPSSHCCCAAFACTCLPVTTEEYNALYLAEPEFVSELVGLVQAEEAVPEEALRTLALRALAAQLHDRSRITSVIAAVTSGGQSGLLSMLLHKSIASILQQADVPLAPSGSGVLPADAAAAAAASAAAAGPSTAGFAAAASSGGAAVASAAAAAPPVGSVAYSVAFVDALLSVVAALVQSSSGYQALNDAGVVAALLPLMRDLHPEHLGLVCTNLRILEAYMDLSQSAATMFRDLGGLTEMIKRLAYEVGVLAPPGAQQQAAAGAGAAGGAKTAGDSDEVMASAEQPSTAGQQQQQQGQAAAPAAAAGGDAATGAVPVKQVGQAACCLGCVDGSAAGSTVQAAALACCLQGLLSRCAEFVYNGTGTYLDCGSCAGTPTACCMCGNVCATLCAAVPPPQGAAEVPPAHHCHRQLLTQWQRGADAPPG